MTTQQLHLFNALVCTVRKMRHKRLGQRERAQVVRREPKRIGSRDKIKSKNNDETLWAVKRRIHALIGQNF